jgi:Glycosyl transferase family 2
MKLFGAAMLRNEADVVESFVRHNLSLLDGLLVVDHGWSDGTSEILDALIAEGLPLEVERDGGPTTNTGRCAQRRCWPLVAGLRPSCNGVTTHASAALKHVRSVKEAA